MSSITLKISSLVIRTLSKPIANQIKAQAREHASFRRLCISFAQRLHRLDMRLRLGLLQDSAAIDRQVAKETAEAQAKKSKTEVPTVKTEAQTKADEAAQTSKEKDKSASQLKATPKPRIRPLSEAKAIDSGASFISETFLFMVGGGLIIFESLRSRRKENSRREDVADRLEELEQSEKNARRALVALEKEVITLRAAKKDASKVETRILPKEVWELEEEEERQDEEKAKGWFKWFSSSKASKDAKSFDSEDTTSQKPIVSPQQLAKSSSSRGQTEHVKDELERGKP